MKEGPLTRSLDARSFVVHAPSPGGGGASTQDVYCVRHAKYLYIHLQGD